MFHDSTNLSSYEPEASAFGVTMKKMLMLGSSNGSCALVQRAKEMGIHTIVTDYLPPERSRAKGKSDEYWMLNTGDVDALELFQVYP